jgi:hypothetical protein
MKKVAFIGKTDGLRRIMIIPILLLITALSTATFSCSSTQQGKVLFESKCAKCHPLDYAFGKKKSLDEWNKITETMARYSEGAITKKEAQIIAKYLANI